MTESEFCQIINIVAHQFGCEVKGIDFDTMNIDINCPNGNEIECGDAISNSLKQCSEVLHEDHGIRQLSDKVSWNLNGN